MEARTKKDIAGYDFGESSVAKSPISMDELEELKQTTTLTDEDTRYLHLAGYALESQTEEIVNTWRSVIAASPHLSYYFTASNRQPDQRYKALVKERFKQWILDVCFRPYDQDWLNYQQEIGLRHTQVKKNLTDGADTPPGIPLRYILAFTAVVINTIKPFLAKKVSDADELEKMHQAWCKTVILHVTLWSRPYVSESEW
jgi:hypothetical protein